MSVSSTLSASIPTAQSGQASPYRQAKIDYSTLSQTLAAGNLSGAQQAYSALQQDVQGIQSAQGAQAASGSSGTSNVQSQLSAVGQALQSGNLTAAKNAFASLQQGVHQSAQLATGHAHHHHGARSTLASFAAPGSTGGKVSSLINTTA
jgi:hypothetical protein